MGTGYISSIIEALNKCQDLSWQSKTGEDLNEKLQIINTNCNSLLTALQDAEMLKQKLEEYKIEKEKCKLIEEELKSLQNQLNNLSPGETEEEQQAYAEQVASIESRMSKLGTELTTRNLYLQEIKTEIERLKSKILEVDIKEIPEGQITGGVTTITVEEITGFFDVLNGLESDDSNIGSLYDEQIPEEYSGLVGEVFGHLTSGMQVVTSQLIERVTRATTFLNKIGVGEGIAVPVIEEYQIPVVEERVYAETNEETEPSVDLDVESEPVVSQPEVYEVQPGDSLSKIAQRYYGSADEYVRIVEANPGITDPNLISVGMELVIPGIVTEVTSGVGTVDTSDIAEETEETTVEEEVVEEIVIEETDSVSDVETSSGTDIPLNDTEDSNEEQNSGEASADNNDSESDTTSNTEDSDTRKPTRVTEEENNKTHNGEDMSGKKSSTVTRYDEEDWVEIPLGKRKDGAEVKHVTGTVGYHTSLKIDSKDAEGNYRTTRAAVVGARESENNDVTCTDGIGNEFTSYIEEDTGIKYVVDEDGNKYLTAAVGTEYGEVGDILRVNMVDENNNPKYVEIIVVDAKSPEHCVNTADKTSLGQPYGSNSTVSAVEFYGQVDNGDLLKYGSSNRAYPERFGGEITGFVKIGEVTNRNSVDGGVDW